LRDQGSVDALRGLGLEDACLVCPDPAFALTSAALDRPPAPAGQRPFAIVSPIARAAWPGSEDESYEAYLRALAAAADHLQQRGLEVRFACSQVKMDPPLIPRVQAAMRGDAGATRVQRVATVDDYLDAVRAAQVVVASRLHAVILALVAGAPVVAVSFSRKVRRQMEDAQLADSCLDLDRVQASELLARVDDALRDPAASRARVEQVRTRLRRELSGHFDRLAALIPRPA
jgi:polysaccharide pyruvyl transferase WcaK-like protein